MRTYLTSALILLALLPLAACWPYSETYTAEQIEGWVVDATSKQPVEGAVVTANWQLLGSMAVPVGELMVMESVTDAKGRFYFPAWKKEDKTGGFIREKGPGLMVFRNGYKLKFGDNYVDGTNNSKRAGPNLKSVWNGRKIEVQKLGGGVEEEFQEYRDFNRELANKVGGETSCDWRSIPKTMRILLDQRKYFEKNGKNNFDSFDAGLEANEKYFSDKGCGSTKQFLESLNK